MSLAHDTRHIPLFEGLSDAERTALFGVSERRACRDGEAIISEGDEGDALFVILSGAVQVEKATLDRGQEALMSLGAGECFGEMTLVDRKPRSATVRALGDTEVAVFRRNALEEGFAHIPDGHLRVLENLVGIVASRLRRVDENLIQSIYDSVIVVDRQMRIMEWNRASGRWSLGPQDGPAEQFIGRDLFALMPHLPERFRERIEGAMAGNETIRFQLEYEDQDSGHRYVDTVVAPYRRGDQVVGATVASRDVTDVKSLERQLIQAEKLAMAGQMAADIGHELNNYLSIISGHAEILRDSPDLRTFPRAVKSLDTIIEQIGRIERFTASLMDFSAQNIRRQPADMNDLIRHLIRFIQPQHRFRNVAFTLDLEADLPWVEIDSGQVQQVLLNLYANAADAMGGGRITTRTRRQKGGIAVTVADEGPGIPPHILAKVFETGFTTKRTGHGFGLSICKRIATNHAGDLTARSEVGSGTTFTLTLTYGHVR